MTSSTLDIEVELPSQRHVRAILLRLTIAAFICYLTIGIPLPVLSLYVHHNLGLSNFLVGVTIGIQFLATVLTRKYAGGVCDHRGPKQAMLKGLLVSSLAGFVYFVAAILAAPPAAKLCVLLSGRLLLGVGESLLITGCLAWGIGLAGQPRAGKVMAWTGMALYGALAVGSPVGLWMAQWGGFRAVSICVTLLPLAAFAVAYPVQPALVDAKRRSSFLQVLRFVLRPGFALAMQGVGFASIGAFVALYFESQHWSGGAIALTAFGGSFVLVRMLFGHLPDRVGGFRVAWVSLVIEIAGQVLLWRAHSAAAALWGAAISGLGCSLMFPSLGVEVVKRAPAENRGTALGAFAAFQDISYGLTAPIAGVVASEFGYRDVFLIGALAALLGVVVAHPLWEAMPRHSK